MAKVDIRNAYRVVQLHEEDRCDMGVTWKGELYIDTVLPYVRPVVSAEDIYCSSRRFRVDHEEKWSSIHHSLSRRFYFGRCPGIKSGCQGSDRGVADP